MTVRRWLIIGVLLTASALMLAACGGSGGTTTTSSEANSSGAEEAPPAEEGEAGEEGEAAPVALEVGETGKLAGAGPKLGSIGAGLMGVEGLEAKLFAQGVPSVESLTPGPEEGEYFASTGGEEGPNGVYLLKEGARPIEVIKGLKPSIGVLWNDNQLYVSTYGEVVAYSDFKGDGFASHRTVLKHLPAGKLGWNGDIKPGPDGRLYMAIGSPCDHCKPKSKLSATVVSFEPDGSDLKTFATGLRGNAFFEFLPETEAMIAVSNERDDVPINDEMVLVQEGDDFGYPACKHDFEGEASCEGIVRPLAEMDAHGAQNGIAFVEGEWGAAEDGLSAISTEWTLGKVIQTQMAVDGDVVTAEPEQIMGGFKNPSSVIVSSGDPETLLIADYGTGKVYSISPGEGGGEEAPAEPEGAQAEGTGKAGGKLAVEADPSGELKFTQEQLTAKAGATEVDFVNESSVPHNVAIEAEGKVVGETEIIAGGSDATELDLEPGTYTFYCAVPGHREAGMEGTLVVK